MAKKRSIFLAIAVLCGFTPWFSWLNYVFLAKTDHPHKFVSILELKLTCKCYTNALSLRYK